MLEKLKEGLQSALKKLIGFSVIDEEAIKEFLRDIQRSLLMADVNVKLVFDLSKRIEKRALEEKLLPGISRKDHIIKILYEELTNIMGKEPIINLPPNKTNVVLLIGIQGSGKTTFAVKLAKFFQKKGYKVGVICADTYRPGAFSQLKMLTSKVNIDLYGDEKIKDAITLAKKGVDYFKAQGKNLVIIDTAGRHKEEKDLLMEMKEISTEINPDLTLLVVDGTIGQQCYSQAEAFNRTVKVGGIVVTKLDGTAKGGGALAAAAATGAQIMFISTGEKVDDIEVFSPTRFVGRLLGLGDIKTLLEKFKELELDEERIKKMMSGKITMEDFYLQLEQLRRMGSLKRLLELLPLPFDISSKEIEDLEDKLKVWKSIIQSMTKEERENPDIINSSRIKRIARGSGRSEADVRELLKRFKESKNLIKSSKGKVLRQMMGKIGKI
ncbi:Signal recognition particle protein [archaeon HR06]|nr:Signal recognition particle protein [archaeon HR06]